MEAQEPERAVANLCEEHSAVFARENGRAKTVVDEPLKPSGLKPTLMVVAFVLDCLNGEFL